MGTIYDIADVVRNSAAVNHPQLIADYDGNNFVKFYDWNSVFEDTTTAIKSISKMHHFRFNRSHPGYFFVKNASDEPETKIDLLKDVPWKP